MASRFTHPVATCGVHELLDLPARSNIARAGGRQACRLQVATACCIHSVGVCRSKSGSSMEIHCALQTEVPQLIERKNGG